MRFRRRKHRRTNATNRRLFTRYQRLNFEVLESRELLAVDIVATKVDVPDNNPVLPGDNIRYTVDIANQGDTDATGVVFSDTIDSNTTLVGGSVAVTPIAFNDTYNTTGNVTLIRNNFGGLLGNDFDPDGPQAPTLGSDLLINLASVSKVGGTTTGDGTLSVGIDGSFMYTPPAGETGTERWQYTVTDGDGLDSNEPGFVDFTFNGFVWFVNSNATPGPGSGTLADPFIDFSMINGSGGSGDVDSDGDTIFVFEGAGNYGSLELENNQQLIGEGVGYAPAGIAAGNAPTLTTTSNAITLAQNNTIRGLNVATTGAGIGIAGSTVGNLTISNVSISGTGQTIGIDGGVLDVTFDSVSSNGAAVGINLSNTTGNFTVTGDGSTTTQGGNDTGGVISNTSGDGVRLNNVTNVMLQNMTIGDTAASAADSGDAINNIGDDGIDATNVTGLTLKNVTIARTATHGVRGTNVTNFTMDDSQNFNAGDADGENGIYFSELRGDNFIRRSLFDAFNETGVEVVNASGTVDITFDDTTFQDNINTVGNAGEEAILVMANGTAEIIALVTGNADTNLTKSIFNDIALEAIQALSLGGGTSPRSSIHLTVENSRFLETGTGDGTIIFNPDFAGDGNITVKNNFFTDDTFGAFAVLLKNDSSGTLDATIQGNTATNLQLVDVNHDNTGSAGPDMANGTTRLLIGGAAAGEGNTDTVGSESSGISLVTTDSGVDADVDLHATVLNNTVTLPGVTFGFISGIYVDVQNTSTARIDIQGNTSNGSAVFGHGLHLKTADSSITGIEGLTGGAQAYLEGNNTFTNGAYIQQLDSSTIVAGNADLPAATTRPNPLMAAPAVSSDQSSVITDQDSVVTDDGVLTAAELDSVVAAAKARWTATGLDAVQQAALDAVTVSVTDMPGWYLAQATGPRIAVDTDAAGYGWFIDATPFDNSEFDMEVRSASEDASLARQASIHMDLLTTVLHEMGHVLGLDHSAAAGDVMSASLTPGVRRVPTAGQAAGAVPFSVASTEYIGAPINIGTLPAGKSVTVTFDVTVNAGTGSGTTISNQGNVMADGGIDVDTDDPDQGGANDPTTTTVGGGAAQPDLVGQTFDVNPLGSDTVDAGDSISLEARVTNNGTAASGAASAAFYLSTDIDINPATDRLLLTSGFGGLNPGASSILAPFGIALPAQGDAFWQGDGTYFVGVVWDSGDVVAESNENNNRNQGLGIDVDDITVNNTAAPPAADVQIVDDGDATRFNAGGFTRFESTTNPQGFVGDDGLMEVHFSKANSIKQATWTFTVVPGVYRVSTTWSPHPNRATNSPFAVFDGTINGTAVAGKTINQQVAPDDFTDAGAAWEDIAQQAAITGTTLTVRLRDWPTNGFVIADAVRIERVINPEIAVTDLLTGESIVSGGTVALFDVLSGVPTTRNIRISNLGSGDLTISDVSLVNTTNNGFSLSPDPDPVGGTGAIGFGGSADFTIALNTSMNNSYAATVTIANNDSDENPFTFTITATVGEKLIIDDGDLRFDDGGFTRFESTTNPQGFVGNDGIQEVHFSHEYHGHKAKWNFTVTPATYRVSATWSPHANRATNSPFTVFDGPATGAPVAAATLNQRIAPGDFSDAGVFWQDIGFVSVSGTQLTVMLRDTPANGFVIADAIRVERIPALLAGGEAIGSVVATEDQLSPVADVSGVIEQAVASWSLLDATAATRLANVTVEVADLPRDVLGLASQSTSHIWLDADAAGHGWALNQESQIKNQKSYDLLTVVTHELGHVLGLPDLDAKTHPLDVMAERLMPEVVRHEFVVEDSSAFDAVPPLIDPNEMVDRLFDQIGKSDESDSSKDIESRRTLGAPIAPAPVADTAVARTIAERDETMPFDRRADDEEDENTVDTVFEELLAELD